MNITHFSRERLYKTFKAWEVPQDFADPMANYLVYGYEPGSCFSAVLANDFIGAIRSSHPSNTVEAFKALAGWIHSHLPPQAYGSYDKVQAWCDLDAEKRRAILEHNRLIYSAKEETWLALKGEEVMA
jgi:hypothetical protein